jgi:hypothetical protein
MQTPFPKAVLPAADAAFSVVPLACGAMLNDAREACDLLECARAYCTVATRTETAGGRAHLHAKAKARLALAATLLRRAADSYAAYGGD